MFLLRFCVVLWMQHSCVKGAYKPWTSTLQSYPGEDCIETHGPDCEVPISQNPCACRNKNLVLYCHVNAKVLVWKYITQVMVNVKLHSLV